MRFGFSWGFGAGDPSIPATSLLYVDGTAVPGDFVAPTESRKLAFSWTAGTFSVLITHPAMTVGSRLLCGYEGDSVAAPNADKRYAARAVAGGILIQISSGAAATTGDGFVTIEVIA